MIYSNPERECPGTIWSNLMKKKEEEGHLIGLD